MVVACFNELQPLTVPADEWARCRGWIKDETEANGFYTIEWIEQELASERLTFWPSEHGAVLTEFLSYPNGKALNIFAACGVPNGSLRELLDTVEPCLVTWAKLAGCRWILGFGRPGFQRTCKHMGYAPKYIVIVKDLANAS